MTLPTPPTLEQRLDAAAEASCLLGSWERLPPDLRRELRDAVVPICRAFAPEHFKDTDTTTGKD